MLPGQSSVKINLQVRLRLRVRIECKSLTADYRKTTVLSDNRQRTVSATVAVTKGRVDTNSTNLPSSVEPRNELLLETGPEGHARHSSEKTVIEGNHVNSVELA